MRQVRIAALALVGGALVISGCGGSSKKTLTRAELTQQADAICRRVNSEITAINHQVRTPSELAKLAPRLVYFEQAGLSELSKLVPPSELADDWKEVLTDAQTLADNTAKIGEYAKNNQTTSMHALIGSTETVQAKLVTIAKRDNLGSCEKAV